MRLLHTETLQFSEYVSPSDAPPYIIASHRWLHDEVSYQEFLKDRANADPEIRKKAGMDKILRFCGYINLWGSRPAETKIPQHVWIDTCCINKDSSAELQEAITSMFEWYAQAWCCLTWLHDVKGDAASLEGSKEFGDSVWFTRGWTLQELLAPKTVIFLDEQWRLFGHKSSTGGLQALASGEPIDLNWLGSFLNSQISQITGIAEPILWDYDKASTATIDERQSWMSKRQTTRREDRAYCMLGICEVFMPLNYGEGANADKRLERKIQKQLALAQPPKLPTSAESDEDISNWQPPKPEPKKINPKFAPNPHIASDTASSLEATKVLMLLEFWLSQPGQDKFLASDWAKTPRQFANLTMYILTDKKKRFVLERPPSGEVEKSYVAKRAPQESDGDREASIEQFAPVRNGKAPGKLVPSAKAGRTSDSTLSDAAKKMLDADMARAKLQAAGRDNALGLI